MTRQDLEHLIRASCKLLEADGWEDRLITICNENTNHKSGRCLDPYDLAFSKLVAGRQKDMIVLENLLRQGIIKPGRLRSMVDQFPEQRLPDGLSKDGLLARISGLQARAARHG